MTPDDRQALHNFACTLHAIGKLLNKLALQDAVEAETPEPPKTTIAWAITSENQQYPVVSRKNGHIHQIFASQKAAWEALKKIGEQRHWLDDWTPLTVTRVIITPQELT